MTYVTSNAIVNLNFVVPATVTVSVLQERQTLPYVERAKLTD